VLRRPVDPGRQRHLDRPVRAGAGGGRVPGPVRCAPGPRPQGRAERGRARGDPGGLTRSRAAILAAPPPLPSPRWCGPSLSRWPRRRGCGPGGPRRAPHRRARRCGVPPPGAMLGAVPRRRARWRRGAHRRTYRTGSGGRWRRSTRGRASGSAATAGSASSAASRSDRAGRAAIGFPAMESDAAGEALAAVPAGRVVLSDRRTRRGWEVELAPYRIGVLPVTRELYAPVAGGPPEGAAGDRRPVGGVSWWDALRFCNALSEAEGLAPGYRWDEAAEEAEWDASADGYRLPTEAEWEYACRAGTDGPRYGPLDEIAWYRGNSQGRPREAGGKRPNAWGLHDTLGGVWEWCWDLYDPEVYGGYRVLRGGGWFDEHWSCRASVRR